MPTERERYLELAVARLVRALHLARRVLDTERQMTADAERVIDNALQREIEEGRK